MSLLQVSVENFAELEEVKQLRWIVNKKVNVDIGIDVDA